MQENEYGGVTPKELIEANAKNKAAHTRLVALVVSAMEGGMEMLECDSEMGTVVQSIKGIIEDLQMEWFQETDFTWSLEDTPGYEDFRPYLIQWRARMTPKPDRSVDRLRNARARDLSRKTGRRYTKVEIGILEKHECQALIARKQIIDLLVSAGIGLVTAKKLATQIDHLAYAISAVHYLHATRPRKRS